ncbi:hypothetical protein BC835DRAFT_27212 [Cytidiella melzeri]|nr:hypothetical protein BC835DRAFT_27212 [Cytidiella melzeri]
MSGNAALAHEIIYEYCITFLSEVDAIWSRKWTLATWLYVLTRYTALVSAALRFSEMIPAYASVCAHCSMMSIERANALDSLQSCAGQFIALDTTIIAKFLYFAVFSAIRVYAVWEGNMLVSGVVFVLALVPFVTNIVHFSTLTIITVPAQFAVFESCVGQARTSAQFNLGLSLTTRLAVILADVIVIIATWSKTFQTYRDARRHGFAAPLVTLLLRDGTIYFIVLLIMNILVVLSNNVPRMEDVDFASPFLENLTSIIICRFIINLRQVHHDNTVVDPSRYTTTIHFAAEMGQPLYSASMGNGGGKSAGSATAMDSMELREVDTYKKDRGQFVEQPMTAC